MYWNNYGKLDSLKNTNKSIAMKFRYDPMGNRIEKRLYHLDGSGSVVRQSATHYVRDAQGNPLAVYDLLGGDTIVLSEFNLYGTNRLGMLTTADTLVCATCTSATAPSVYLSPVGNKRYELSNHLGNVMTVISDKPVPSDTTSDGLWDYFNASMVSATDYYPFGMKQPNRASNITQYRFGFNGIERSDNICGMSDHYEFRYREYEARIGRFWSVDPLFIDYPWNSTYAFAENRVVDGIDLEGLEWFGPILTLGARPTPVLRPVIESTVRSASEISAKASDAMQRGRATETSQLKRLGLEKNKEATTVEDRLSGERTTTIPDAIRPNGQTVEIKDVKYQALSRQLRAQQKMSEAAGEKPQLYVPENTRISKPLEQSNFDIQRYIPQQDNTQVFLFILTPPKPVQPLPCENCL